MEKFYENNNFILLNDHDSVLIEVFQVGYDINRFQEEILTLFPRVKILKVSALQNALQGTIKGKIEIGNLLPICSVTVNNDGLVAYAELALTEDEFTNTDQDKINQCIFSSLKAKNINYGIVDLNKENMTVRQKFVVAKGTEPIPGTDAVIKLYEIEAVHPKLEGAGTVDHYELSIINRILKGDWLGERIEPTEGVDGTSIYSTPIQAAKGKQKILKYDPKTVKEVYLPSENKTELRAMCDGAVTVEDESVAVQNTIEVEGNVGFSTGNINFNGFVDIKGSIEDNFSVIADENIQIEGDMGVGAVELIESRNGDIYIKSGIAGRHKAVIRAKGNVYTKFASDCSIIADGTVNIGYYALNCNITAKDVVFEAPNSRLIGGETMAEIKVSVGELGSKSAPKTLVHIHGFERQKLKEDYEAIDGAIKTLTENGSEKNSEKLKKLKAVKLAYSNYLKVKGEGEICATHKVYPNVVLGIRDQQLLIQDERRLGIDCYFENGKIVVKD